MRGRHQFFPRAGEVGSKGVHDAFVIGIHRRRRRDAGVPDQGDESAATGDPFEFSQSLLVIEPMKSLGTDDSINALICKCSGFRSPIHADEICPTVQPVLSGMAHRFVRLNRVNRVSVIQQKLGKDPRPRADIRNDIAWLQLRLAAQHMHHILRIAGAILIVIVNAIGKPLRRQHCVIIVAHEPHPTIFPPESYTSGIMQSIITGKAYVLGDNIDTDQIIPAKYLSFNPSIPEERRYFGMYALSSVPDGQAGLPGGKTPFVRPNEFTSDYQIVIGGKNFGSGSSREHAPLALAEAGVKCVIAEFYARIFFRNSVNGGYLIPIESTQRLVEKVRTGDELEVDLTTFKVKNKTKGETYDIHPLGDVLPIIEAGDVFEYAKQTGMLK
jgi:3-isopropylmalate/(R)-2-methylmalate dehydratase small subunit